MPADTGKVAYPLIGGGELGQLVRDTDWSGTLLGNYSTWSPTLRASLSMVLNTKGIAALYWGPEQLLLYNDAYAVALGDRHPTAFGRPIVEVLPDLAPVLGPQVAEVLATGKGFSIENLTMTMRRFGRDEETSWTYGFSPVQGEDGAFAGVLLLATEMTEQRAAERRRDEAETALRRMNDTLEEQVATRTEERNSVWQLSRDMLGIASDQGIWEAINPAWSRVLGWTPDQVIGKTSEWMEHPDDRAKTRAEIEGLAAGTMTLEFENRFRASDGSYRTLSWTAVPEGQRLYCVARDVTVEREDAARLVATEAALRQAQKMEAVGQLTGGLAHDFNNLLTGMMGNMELLQARIARGRLDDIDRFISAAQGAGRRAASLTQRLLAFSRRQTLDPRPTDVNRLIANVEDLLRRTVGGTAQIEVVGAAGLWTANIDAGQLENAILNLCINARDAMPEGGRITIETANKWFDDRTAKEQDMPPGQYLSVCVTDTGSGMSAETITRAFEPFYTTKPIGQGTGLGLSMIYGFARQSGGQVRIYSEVNDGTTVCVYLPRHLGEADAGEVSEVLPIVETASGQTILVVDDEPTIRHLIDEVMEEAGYAVIGVGDGAAGIKVLQAGTRVDLLITDVGLPNGMNGRQVADAARTIMPDLKVLFITGYAENAAVGNGHLEPGMELLTKPFSMDALVAKVAGMLKDARVEIAN